MSSVFSSVTEAEIERMSSSSTCGTSMPEARMESWYKADELMKISTEETKPLIAVEFPGIVQNTAKALKILGGLSSISKSLLVDKRKLALSFRPEDPYCRPVYSNKIETENLLMRIRRRPRQVAPLSSLDPSTSCDTGRKACDSDRNEYEYKVEILGVISTTHKFQGMCDFQYLPVVKEDGAYQNILSKIQANAFSKRAEFLSRDVPLFLPPVIFSRFDTPQDYGFRSDKKFRRTEDNPDLNRAPELMGPVRKRRAVETQLINFTDKEVPCEPQPQAVEIASRFKDTGLEDELKKLFEIRPMWLKSALRYHLRDNPNTALRLKRVLPAVAYYFSTGPWSRVWVKFGYDPRKEPSAKKYQTIDFRMRQKGFSVEDRSLPWAKRRVHQQFLKPSLHPTNAARVPEINMGLFQPAGDHTESGQDKPKLSDFEFHADVMPSSRQVYYQLCDIYDQEVQALVAKNDGKEGPACDERHGWCVKDINELVRHIMSEHMQKLCPRPPSKDYQKKRLRELKKIRNRMEEEESDDEDDNLEYT